MSELLMLSGSAMITAVATAATKAHSRPYSIRSSPLSSCRKRTTRFFTGLPPLPKHGDWDATPLPAGAWVFAERHPATLPRARTGDPTLPFRKRRTNRRKCPWDLKLRAVPGRFWRAAMRATRGCNARRGTRRGILPSAWARARSLQRYVLDLAGTREKNGARGGASGRAVSSYLAAGPSLTWS